MLRGELGYDDVVVTDALDMAAIAQHFDPLDAAKLAINAGVDILLMPADISTDDGEFGQRLMFRNSYDKTMSFAVVAGGCCLICSNGCIAGDYQYKRIHKGVILGETSTTKEDIVTNINGGISVLQTAFENIVRQMNELKYFEVSPQDTYNILGELFFKKEVLTITQMSIIKRELQFSKNFKHLFDKDFTAFDLYNHVTQSLKSSHATTYISDHINTHELFKKLFKLD